MTFKLRLSAALDSPRTLASPRGSKLSLPRHTSRTRTPLQTPRAIQTPVPLSSLQLMPSRSDAQDLELEEAEAVVVELRMQLEEIWHEYAAARKRNLAMVEQVERLQSSIKRLEAEACEERFHRQEAEAKLAALQKATEHCEL